MKRYPLFFFALFAPCLLFAQSQPDELTIREFYDQIFRYHPLVKQAQSLNALAQQELRMARGNFDPKFSTDFDRKQFDKKEYYQTFYSKLKAPIWVGEFQASFERNQGTFLDESLYTDGSGLLAVGVGIPIGRNILMDERRNTLRQAQLAQNVAEAEKIKLMNKILVNASKEYAEWYFAYHQYRLLQAGYKLAEERYLGVKQRMVMGELAPIDSVQALITLQERDVALQQGEVDWRNAGLRLSNYLWGDNDTPLQVEPNVIPQVFAQNTQLTQASTLQELLTFAQQNHPEIRKNSFKRRQLDFEERLQVNNLMPNLQLNYNMLRNVRSTKETTNWAFRDNYKVGFTFEMPLLLRKERSKLQMVRIKQLQVDWEIQSVQREVSNEIQASHNELLTYSRLLTLQDKMVDNYRILRDGEIRRFWAGESSLFIINAQEAKYIESQIKLEQLRAKYIKAQALLLWSAGKPLWE
ncbi:MAG: TolC family protein [Bacteroidetes bacterium]|nr:MAG: TolC family protein [Bacteroidota bacterium]